MRTAFWFRNVLLLSSGSESKQPVALLGACLPYSPTRKMDEVCSSRILVNFYQTTRLLISEYSTVHSHRLENLIPKVEDNELQRIRKEAAVV
jgi:hypothetical protein